MSHYSDKCSSHLDTYYDKSSSTCVPCVQTYPIRPGHEHSPNCGRNDDGGESEFQYRVCLNNASFLSCHPCTYCPENYQRPSDCNPSEDKECCKAKSKKDCVKVVQTTTTPMTATATATTTKTATATATATTKATVTVTQIQEVQPSTRIQASTLNPTTENETTYLKSNGNHLTTWVIVLTVILVLSLLTFLYYIIKRKSFRGMERPRLKLSVKCCVPSHNILYPHTQPQSCKTGTTMDVAALLPQDTKSLEDHLGPDLQSAPLQMVLNNLDVLEELVILLDPESPGVKNTSHLASRCSFPATWITYTYSLRDSKSPLRAVLEGVTTKNPEWTVGHLARLLRDMDRNDAVAVLSKLSFPKEII
ncbi:hypothetical protein DPEC_G00145330 [Dallia pectoralis]|uniref:Uncharacterized protein n=1 Tax=Dallia pectoralis TaxID=75939 RepID=A0ACC2GNW2_DALPE|nr:hypothetical protein DPEC_G00145330 [Dallia pectoralis]